MNFSFYIYGNPGKRYSQYPDDYTASTLSAQLEGVKGARLTIFREMDLEHYAYSEHLGNGNTIGICLIFNKSRCLRPGRLVVFFRSLIESHLVETGKIIKYNNNGILEFNVKTLSDSIKEYERLKDLVNSELENRGETYYGISPLKTIYNGERTYGELGNDATDENIIEMTNLHNKVIVNYGEGVEHGYLPKIINELRYQILQKQGDVDRLTKENKALDKKKKQYRYVLLLSMALIGLGCGLLLLNNHLNTTKSKLEIAHQTIDNKNDSIQNLKSNINHIQSTLNDEVKQRKEIETSFNNFKETIDRTQPLFITSTSFNFGTGYLSFEYYGFHDQEIRLGIRAYNGSQSYFNSSLVNIQEGFNTNSIYLAHGLNSSSWYSFELLIDEIIIGGGRH